MSISCCCLDLWLDNTLRQDFLITDATGNPVDGATVEATVTDLAGDPISGVPWPVALAPQGSGVYRLELDGSNLQVFAGQRVTVEIVAEAAGFTATQRCATYVRERPITCA